MIFNGNFYKMWMGMYSGEWLSSKSGRVKAKIIDHKILNRSAGIWILDIGHLHLVLVKIGCLNMWHLVFVLLSNMLLKTVLSAGTFTTDIAGIHIIHVLAVYVIVHNMFHWWSVTTILTLPLLAIKLHETLNFCHNFWFC